MGTGPFIYQLSDKSMLVCIPSKLLYIQNLIWGVKLLNKKKVDRSEKETALKQLKNKVKKTE